MREVIEKLAEVEKSLAASEGPFLLFALFLRDDAPNVWDLLVCADWIRANRSDALRKIVDAVRTHLGSNVALLSRIVVLEPSDPPFVAITQAFQVERGDIEVDDCDLFGLRVRKGHVFVSRRQAAA